jgi:hypothetical protein
MLKKTLIAFSLIVLVALALAVISVAAEENLSRCRSSTGLMRSRNHLARDVYYYLYVPAGEERSYTVQRLDYTHNLWACGDTSTGSVSVKIQTRWVFTPCGGEAPNWGEPNMEKIHISDAPDGPNWRFRHD